MKIAINALPFTSWQGIEVFLAGLLRAWPDNPEDQVIVFANEKSAKFLNPLPDHIKLTVIPFSKLNKAMIFIHQLFSFGTILRKNKIDILFCPSLMSPWFFKNKIVTIHDAAPFIIKGETSSLGKLFWKINLLATKMWSLKIITVSEFSRRELIDKLKIKANCIEVVGVNALTMLNIDSGERILNNFSLANTPYFISIGNARTRKNLARLISAFDIFNQSFPEAKLLIVGKKDQRMLELEVKNGNKNIEFTGFVSDAEKNILLARAQALVFPSYYEGFGIPIIEAQQLNTPVLCSEIPVFREVAGAGAIFFDPLDETSIVSALKRIFNNQLLKTEIIDLGKDNYPRYSWKKIVDKLLNIIKNENTSD